MTTFFPYEEHLEVVVSPNSMRSLLDEPESLWTAVVQAGGGHILSTIRNQACRASILSSSSLFAFPNRVILITCGPADVLAAAQSLFAQFDTRNIAELRYTYRRSPNLAVPIPTSRRELATRLLPQATQTEVSQPDQVQLQLRQHASPDQFPIQRVRLYFDLAPDKMSRLSSITEYLPPDFESDEHHFSPQGYSMNAISEAGFATLHASPEHGYVSFEYRCAASHTLSQLDSSVATRLHRALEGL